jgi:MinD-like ATPase involved in chromosome partitioning or flagellar assembly
VIDLDPQCDATTGLGAIGEFNETCADVLKSPKHNVVHKAIVSSTWAKIHSTKIDVMVGSPKVQQADAPSPTVRELWKLEEALARIETEYDLVIIDTPPSINGLTKTAWVTSDRILIVTEPSLFSVVAAERSIRAINELRKAITRRLKVFGVVVNRYKPLSKEHQFRVAELNEKYPGKLLPQLFEEKSTMQQAQGAAMPIHSWPGDTAASIAASFDHVLDALMLDLTERVYDEDNEKSRRNRKEKRRMKLKRGKGIESSPLAVLMGSDYNGEDKAKADPLEDLISSASSDDSTEVTSTDVAAQASDAGSGSDGGSSSD